MTTQSEEWNVARLLSWTADYLEQQGSDSARLDAEVLLGHVCRVPRIQLYARYHDVVPERTRAAFRECVKRRAAGEPVAYIVGSKEFYSLSFRVTQDVLVPRPETEHLVLESLEILKARSGQPAQVLDLGTGSGVVSVCLAKYADCQITAVDISSDSIEIAKENAETHGVGACITFLEGDLYAPLPQNAMFDLIVSNPPYVSESEFSELEPTVRDYEPKAALVSGPTGVEVIQRILEDAGTFLIAGGWLLLELSPMIATRCAEAARQTGDYAEINLLKDYSGHARVLRARRTGMQAG